MQGSNRSQFFTSSNEPMTQFDAQEVAGTRERLRSTTPAIGTAADARARERLILGDDADDLGLEHLDVNGGAAEGAVKGKDVVASTSHGEDRGVVVQPIPERRRGSTIDGGDVPVHIRADEDVNIDGVNDVKALLEVVGGLECNARAAGERKRGNVSRLNR